LNKEAKVLQMSWGIKDLSSFLFMLLPVKPQKGREAAALSFIKEIQEVQGGKKRHMMVSHSSPKMPK